MTLPTRPTIHGGDPASPIIHHLGPLDRCPGCEGSDFLVDEHGGPVMFRCLGCGETWRYELGFVWRVAS